MLGIYVLLAVKLLILLVACIVLLWHRKVIGGQWALTLQLVVATVVEAIADLYLVLDKYNLRYYDAYLFIEFALLMTFAYHQWQHRGYRLAIVLAVPVFLLVAVPDLLRAWPAEEFTGQGFMASSALLLGAMVTLLFREALLLDRTLFKGPSTWILLGMVLYFGCSIPLFGLLNAITTENAELASRLYTIMDVLYVLRYGAIVGAVLLFRDLRT